MKGNLISLGSTKYTLMIKVYTMQRIILIVI